MLATDLQSILQPGQMSASCSHGSNEQVLSPSRLSFLPKSNLPLISQHPKESCRFHDIDLSLPLPFKSYTRTSSHRPCRSYRSGEETLLPKGLQVVKSAPARSSRADSVRPKLLPFSLYLFRSLSPTDTSICVFFSHYLPPFYTFLLLQLHLVLSLLISQTPYLFVEGCSLRIYSSLALFSTPLMLYFFSFLPNFATSHTTSRLPPPTPFAIDTFNYQHLPLRSLPTRPLTIGYSTIRTLT
jgi:hypothetical protein